MRFFYCVLLSLLINMLTACHHRAATAADDNQTITVQKHKENIVLYYSATIKPLEVISVPSPVDGIIDKVYFHYGQRVQKGDPLVSIRSPKLLQDYQDTLSGFLKDKDAYLAAQNDLNANEDLYNAGLIPRNTYDTSKRQLATAYLQYNQSQQKLNNFLATMKNYISEDINFSQLDLEDTSKVQEALSIKINIITVPSPTFGIILLPDKNNNDGENAETKILKEGAAVKQDDSLVSLGDFSGMTLTIDVNEIDINNIKPGQSVLVTGVAFPNMTLHGYVSNIDIQAVQNMSGGLPTFPVEIVVPELSVEERNIIHIGMSAKIELLIEQPAIVTIPMQAIYLKNTVPMVKRINEKTGEIEEVPVVPGKPTLNSVIILKGLKEGDRVLVNH